MKLFSVMVCVVSLLCACATRQADRFYILSPQPQGPSQSRAAQATHATLTVSLPSLVDRPEMILNTSADGVLVLEHERWAAPLPDLVTQTLAQDIERRRADVLLVGQSLHRSGDAGIKIAVDVVQMTVRKGERASIEAHWRVTDVRSGKDAVGGEVFGAAVGPDSYAEVARALSECLGLLADRLAGQMPPPSGGAAAK